MQDRRADTKIPLVISYYANNMGTTDYLLDFLKNKHSPFYYLKHPLPEMKYDQSTLLFFDGKEEKLVSAHKSSQKFVFKIARELFLNGWIALKLSLRGRTRTIIGFGSMNAASVAVFRLLGKKIVFWGVDYSPSRFDSGLLNAVYGFTETLACKSSNVVIQPSRLQEVARIKHHSLRTQKSVILPNGIKMRTIGSINKQQSDTIRFIYIGSITPQHGILNFLKHLHEVRKRPYVVTIFGDGVDLQKLQRYVHKYKLEGSVELKGSMSPSEIETQIDQYKEQLIGVAPYVSNPKSHVAFGDSLKIKEYVNHGMPFIASSAISIDDELKRFGHIYTTDDQLRDLLEQDLLDLNLPLEERERYLSPFDWNHLFSKNSSVSSLLLQKGNV